jgi:excisionase family DNA binding protein
LAAELLTERQVADRYHVTVHSVRRWRREGRVSFLKIGRQVLFRPADLEAFEAGHEVRPWDSGGSGGRLGRRALG